MWELMALKESENHSEWVLITTKPDEDSARYAARMYKRLNPGAETKVQQAGKRVPSWSVYEAEPTQGKKLWKRVSDWATWQAANKAAKVKRMQRNDRVYGVFPTGSAPDPENEDVVDIELARRRNDAVVKIAQALYDGRADNPNVCRAHRPGESLLKGRCVLMADHIPPEHKSALQIAQEQMRRADEGGDGWPLGGWSEGRKWMPPHSHDGREANDPFRPGDPGEDPSERDDVTPAGEGWTFGDPNRARKGSEST